MMAVSQQRSTVTLADKVAFLSRPDTYPETSKVEALETHMSWVFLTDRDVYKLKKPVRYDFLDFRTLEARQRFAEEEVRINKRLAADVYQGTVPLTRDKSGSLALDGRGEVVDWLIKMKRLPREFMLDTVIAENKVVEEPIRKTAEFLADFYFTSPPVYPESREFRANLAEDIRRNSRDLLYEEFGLSAAFISDIANDLLNFLDVHNEVFATRIAEGRVIDAHGDLRPEHVCVLPESAIIDRLEFDPALRVMDVAEELSFLAMECEVKGSSSVGELFFEVYREKTADEIPSDLISFYKAKRALLRARLSLNHLLDENYRTDQDKWRSRGNNYLSAARRYCDALHKNGHAKS